MNNQEKKRGAFAQLQAVFEQAKAEFADQMNEEFGDVLPDFAKFIKPQTAPREQQSNQQTQMSNTARQQPQPTDRQSGASRQQPRPTERQVGTSRQQTRQARSTGLQTTVRPNRQTISTVSRPTVSGSPRPNTPAVSPGRAVASNLNSTSARDAIILSEIIGKPISKRRTIR